MISNSSLIINHLRTSMLGFRSSREKIVQQFGEQYFEEINDTYNELLDKLDPLRGNASRSFSNKVPTDQVIKPNGTENENIIL